MTKLTALCIMLAFSSLALAAKPEVISVQKIWDEAPHNAFTDLIRFNDQFFCVFRESAAHVGGDGKIRVLASTDGNTWSSVALIGEKGIDLRDAKLSVTPDGRLMMVCGGSIYEGKKLLGRQPRVCFSNDGASWTAPQRILAEGDWLWRVTWHDGKAYGASYKAADKATTKPWDLKLYAGDDGVKYELVANLEVPDRPNETTLRFLPDGQMMALVRREGGSQNGWIGTSARPYTSWSWHEIDERLGGPNFIVMPDATLLAAGRTHKPDAKTIVARMTPTSYEPLLTLPSGGDCSYPGMVLHGGALWLSYYSSHEGKTSIYLAKIQL